MNKCQNDILLSICIPTYNRSKELKECLQSIIPQCINFSNEIEIVISDNCSPDLTTKTVESFTSEYPNLSYYRNETNIGPENNFRVSFLRAKGKYVWLIGDDDKIHDNGILKVMEILRRNCSLLIVNFSIYSKDFTEKICNQYLTKAEFEISDHNDVMRIFGGFIGLISCHVVKRELLVSVDEVEYRKYNEYGFSFLYSIYRVIQENGPILYLNKPVVMNRAENSIIDWPKFFITGLSILLKDLKNKGYRKNAIKVAKNKILIKMVIPYLIFRKKMTGIVKDVKLRTAEGYSDCWPYWVLFLPLSLLPNFPFKLIRKAVRLVIRRKM